MPVELTSSPALVLALALAAGITAQILARHLRVPGIVVLLAVGVLLGPEILGLVDPGALGHAMHDVVGFAVAVILFEGGLNLNVGRLRREALPIRRLLTLGAVTTLLGATLAVHSILGKTDDPAGAGLGAQHHECRGHHDDDQDQKPSRKNP